MKVSERQSYIWLSLESMARYAGIKKNSIHMVSDHHFASQKLQIVELPVELHDVSPTDLITDYRFKNGKFSSKSQKKPARDLKVALVGNWKMRCGISTYAENLWPEVAKHVGSFKLFVEHNDLETENLTVFGDTVLQDDQVVSCWKRGDSLVELIQELKEYDPDIIWIQHEFGLWPNACYWLSFLNQLSDYRIIVTMHSVFHHQDKTICEAAMPEIVVHLEGARDVLKNEKQIPGKVYVVPHGCAPHDGKPRLWNYYKSEQTFMQFGFGFRYKGWELSIEAVSILKKKYPNVFFTGLFSESPFNKVDHQMYYNDLMELVETLGVQENVAIIRGYQSDATLDSYLRTNQATVFPYISHPAHEVFGVSGAARLAMSKGLPVVTTTVNHFSDLPTLKGATPAELAEALDLMFSSPEAKKEQIAKQFSYLNDNTWEHVALKYIAIFEKSDIFDKS